MKYLLIKGWGGLGDRTMAVATGLLYARLTGRRPVVDWTDSIYSADGSNAFFRLFDCPAAGDIDEIAPTDSVAPAPWRGRLDQSTLEVREAVAPPGSKLASHRQACVDLMRIDHPEDVIVMWSRRQRVEWLRPHFRGRHSELANRHADVILSQILATEIAPNPEIRDRIGRFRHERLPGPTIGVHVRHSDRRTRLDAIRRRLERRMAAEDGATVFLATDNAAVRDEFERSYGAVSAPHWYAAPGEPLHKSPDRPNALEVGVEALVDLYLLAGCDRLIIDRESNFSKVAAVLSGAERSRIDDVQALRARWRVPLTALWRLSVPGPVTPLAVPAMRRWGD